ncbi:MAG: hypothetical protein H6738_07220 [Alphaproteobacteria bacterium]|nr:hypothetical protein [Alphaproteobacteria bacterium]MCB9696553.1 hypothetical protein [Alphaproteobacteria bacterium]
MYNLLLALAAGTVVFGLTAAALSPIAGVLPALIVVGGTLYALGRRTNTIVQAELAGVGPLLQQRKIDEAVALLEGVKARHGKWQFLLSGQLDAQVGLLDYLQMKWDTARPKLEAGKWRNWTALVCLGAIDYRQGRKDEAWKRFAEASDAAPNEILVYQIQATLQVRDGLRKEALETVARGLEANKDHQALKDLQSRIANQKKIDTGAFGENWFQFFPEDLMKQAVMRGRKGATPAGPVPQQAPRIGARHAPRR